MCLIRGRSDAEDLERIAEFIHAVPFALEAVLFWEYIPTKYNWADPISRLPGTPSIDLPFPAIVEIVQFL